MKSVLARNHRAEYLVLLYLTISLWAVPVTAFMFESTASRQFAASEAAYPRSDTVPARLIDKIITEADVFSPRAETEEGT